MDIFKLLGDAFSQQRSKAVQAPKRPVQVVNPMMQQGNAFSGYNPGAEDDVMVGTAQGNMPLSLVERGQSWNRLPYMQKRTSYDDLQNIFRNRF